MASTRRTLELIIEGITNGLGRAVTEAEAAARAVEAAERNADRARVDAANTASRLATAEDALAVARARNDAAMSRVGVAETNLARVRAGANEGASRLAQAEAELDQIRARGGSSTEIENAERRIVQVRQEADLAARRTQAAEAALAAARANAIGSAARVEAAERRVAEARRLAETAGRRLSDAEAELIRRRGELDDASNRGGGFRSFLAGLTSGVSTFRALGNLIGDTSTRLGGLGQVLGSLGGPIVQVVTGLAQIVAITALWVEIIGVLGGLVGQALGGIPALLLAITAAAGTVLLGMDGIKKAAEVLKPAFDKLKASVSDTFEKGLTPAFKQLAAVIPQLTPGFQNIARALSDMAAQVIRFIASAQGLTTINSILNGTAGFLRALTPGITAFVKGLLDAANIGAPAFQRLGEALAAVLAQLGGVFSKLADSGVIQQAVLGLASTIQGLGNVIGPVVEILLRMGAALGTSLGGSLTDLGNIIQSTIPFFTKLADVAGKILLDAFEQLKGPIIELVNSVFPGFSSGLDGLQSLMHNTVLPAIAGFINFLRTDGIPGIIAFTQGMIINFTAAGSAILGFVSGALTGLQQVLKFAAVLTGNQAFLEMAGQIEVAKAKIDGLKTSLDGIHDKTVNARANVQGSDAVKGLANAIFSVTGKTVNTISNVFGKPENEALTGAIDKVLSKIVSTTSNVPGGPLLGTEGNNALTGAIGGVNNKTVTTTGNVPGGPTLGTEGNQALRAAIDNVINKTVTVTANVNGTSAVQGLVNAIAGVVSKTVTVTVNTIQRTLGFASGGFAPGGTPIVVGEQGPELITLPKGGGFVFTAAQTQAILGGRGSASPAGSSAEGGDFDPVTVTVNLSQEAIAGIAEVVITRRDRQTKRTVFAGSGVTV